MEAILSMKNIYKEFGKTTALKGVSFDVQSGEIFGFLGPSGAGKTTTVKLFTAQLLQSSGELSIMGKNVMKHRNEVFNHIGVLTDTSGLYERLSVLDNLMLFAKFKNVPEQQVKLILNQVGLEDQHKKVAGKLSRGMKQRVMLVRALLNQPKILFLDEPTASLDPGTTLEIHKLLRSLNANGTTIFLTTHNMEEADKLCNRVAFLNNGEIVELGPPEFLKRKYASDQIELVLNNGSKQFVKKDAEGGNLIKDLLEKNALSTLHSLEPSLEKIFLNITGKELS